MPSQRFERFAGLTAFLAGVAELLYAIAFIILHQALFAALCLTVFGALAIGVWLGMYLRVRDTDRDFALLALILGLVGAIGGSIHGGYDLANAINPPALSLQQAGEFRYSRACVVERVYCQSSFLYLARLRVVER